MLNLSIFPTSVQLFVSYSMIKQYITHETAICHNPLTHSFTGYNNLPSP